MGRSQNMAYNDLVRPEEEDWHMVRDSAERRKIQNRLAQRAYRRNIKYRSLELEKLKQELSEIRQKTQETTEEQDCFAQDDVPTQPTDAQNSLIVPLGPFWSQQPDGTDSRPRAVSASCASPAMADQTPSSVPSDATNRPRATTLSPRQISPSSSSRFTPRRDASSTWLPSHPQIQYPHLGQPELDLVAGGPCGGSMAMDLFPFTPDVSASPPYLAPPARQPSPDAACMPWSGTKPPFAAQQSSLLHLAAQNGHSDVLRMLLQRGGIDVDCRDGAGFSPLQLAVAAGRAESVQMLLDYGADPRAGMGVGLIAYRHTYE